MAGATRGRTESSSTGTRGRTTTGSAPSIARPAPHSVDAGLTAKEVANATRAHARTRQDARRADVLFLPDFPSSMEGEIHAIKETMMDCADMIAREGVDLRLGMIAFRDRLIDAEPTVLTFEKGEPFTSDPAAFRRAVGPLKTAGGDLLAPVARAISQVHRAVGKDPAGFGGVRRLRRARRG